MTWTWQNPDRGPTPAELAAWAEGELDSAAARRVEFWLVDHPEAVEDAESECRLIGLFRDHAPLEPSSATWQATLDNIHVGLSAPAPLAGRLPPWRLRVVVALLGAAALLGGVLLAGLHWPRLSEQRGQPIAKEELPPFLPPGDDNDEPFAVVSASEINIISMNVADVDRLVMDRPLLGTVEFVAPADIEVVKVEPDPEEGNLPRLQRGPQVPMVVLARVDDEEP